MIVPLRLFALVAFVLPLFFVCKVHNENDFKQQPFSERERFAVSKNGRLQVIGRQLCNAAGEPVWLRGMSSHGLQWYADDINPDSLDVLINEWKCDVIRLSLYAREGGYESNPDYFTRLVEEKIELIVERDTYVLVDWHMLTPGDPWADRDNAVEFFSHIAARYADYPHVIYEICNEPNGVDWSVVKSYAEDVIPIIRNIDPVALIIVGTTGWSSLGISEGKSISLILENPVNADNILYSFHFYAASHSFNFFGNTVRTFAQSLPLFVSECGTQDFTGDGPNNFNESDRFFNMFEDMKISWVYWNFSHDWRSGAVLRYKGNYTDLKDSGKYIKQRIAAAGK